MALDHVVTLVGGVGGAKLVLGLARILAPAQLTVIVNTGDDLNLYGLSISPDVDTVLYTLSGLAAPDTGWGMAGDTTQMLDMLRTYGQDPWFQIKDRDLATHLLRSQWLAEGLTLTEAIERLRQGLGIAHPVLPMSDDPVRTQVHTREHGVLGFQEYFVRERWQPVVTALEYQGAATAQPSAAVRAALAEASLVVIGPSNPLLSIAPILAIPGMREALAGTPCVAVSPIVGGTALKGPAAKMMDELGLTASAQAVAAYYGDLLTGFVLDERDTPALTEADFACPVLVTDTVMQDEAAKIRLAQNVLAWAEEAIV